jgi:hypothetical protein
MKSRVAGFVKDGVTLQFVERIVEYKLDATRIYAYQENEITLTTFYTTGKVIWRNEALQIWTI